MADQGAEGILSPFLRRQRINAARQHLNGKLLDVGCGTGMLSNEVLPDWYLGVDIDRTSLEIAKANSPMHKFQDALPNCEIKFDTIVALAVIEHLRNPEQFLAELAKRMQPGEVSRIIITTPHPSLDWIHDFGASIGLFSKHANEEHEELLDRNRLESIGANAGLRLASYKKFLFGANQIAVFRESA